MEESHLINESSHIRVELLHHTGYGNFLLFSDEDFNATEV